MTHYIHGTHADEQRRLQLMNRLLNEASLREAAIASGERLIDFGCGLGEFARLAARAAGIPAIGIERSEQQIAEAVRLAGAMDETNLLEIRLGDVLAPPLAEDELGTFDVAHARFLLEHLGDPLAAVKQMVRAVKPGGRIILEDDDHDVMRLWPVPPGVLELWNAYIRTYDRNGNDPFIGRRLVSLLHQAGATPRRNHWIFFGGCTGMGVFPGLVENMIGILEGARDAIVGPGLFDDLQFDATIERFRHWSRRRDASMWFAMAWAEGVR